MHERWLTRLDLMRVRRQVLCGQALQWHSSSFLGRRAYRHVQNEVGNDDQRRRMRALALVPSDTVAGLPALNILAHLCDLTCALGADEGVLQRMHTRTTVRIGEIHARGRLVDEQLTRAGLGPHLSQFLFGRCVRASGTVSTELVQ